MMVSFERVPRENRFALERYAKSTGGLIGIYLASTHASRKQRRLMTMNCFGAQNVMLSPSFLSLARAVV
jgi:hypothetical protein